MHHARVCKENKLELEKKNLVEIFCSERIDFERCRRTVTPGIQLIFTTKIIHSIKILVLYKLKLFCARMLIEF